MKRIAVDFDDVIIPAATPFVEFCSRRLNKHISIDDLNSPDSYELFEGQIVTLQQEFGKDESWIKLHQTPPSEDCKNKLLEFKSKDYDLVILTARDEGARPITEQYINTHLPNIFSAFYFSNRKGYTCKKENIDILIDDNLINIYDAEINGVIGIPLGSWSWTRTHPKCVPSWKDLEL